MARESNAWDSTHLTWDLAKWEVQLRKGVLEMIILLALREKEHYGFALISGIGGRSALNVPEGTLYPLLLRLARDGLIQSRLAEGDGGAPRKYYRLTPSGEAAVAAMTTSWRQLAHAVGVMTGKEEG